MSTEDSGRFGTPADATMRLTRKPAPSSGPDRSSPVPYNEADNNLEDTLDSLDGAHNYAGWILSLAEPYLGQRVLEVGAGHGTFTEVLAQGHSVVATEISPRCLETLRARFSASTSVEVREGNLDQAVEAGPYDSAVLINVLEHIEDDHGALALLSAALNRGGHVVVWAPAHPRLYSDFDRRVGHFRRYRAEELAETLSGAGLEVVKLRHVNAVGALAWWVLATKAGRTPTTSGLVGLYDRLAIPVLRRVEGRLQPPFGQSLLCVGRRPDGKT